MKHLFSWLFWSFLIFGSVNGYGQKYKIEGTIRDSKTNQPIVNASINLKNSNLGASANDQGVFRLDLDSLPAV